MCLKPVFWLLFLSGASFAENEDPVVEMAPGKVRGYKMKSSTGRKFLAFSSIPYAKPPVGDLRFQAPQPMPLWRGIREAKENGPECIQFNALMNPIPVTGVEDCLYLSVYTHNVSGNAPVLVHIHGGGFNMGSRNYYKPTYFMDEDIVVVQVNYRVGIFGFLSFENEKLPGNQGMKDQVMALRWVQENIACFGGDPNQVTIMGESAGGASVYHHIVSPLSIGLFHRAVAQSGSSFCNWAVTPQGLARSNAEKLLKLIDCPTNLEDAISCILEKDAMEIASKFTEFVEFIFFPIQKFGPVIEAAGPDSFLVGPIYEWRPRPVPLILGLTSGEGLLVTAALLKTKWFDKFTQNFNKLASYTYGYLTSSSNPDKISEEIKNYYFKNGKVTMDDWNNLTMSHGDSLFTHCVMEAADKHKGDVYFYYYDSIVESIEPNPIDPKLVTGANHASEAQLLWDAEIPGFPVAKKTEDNMKLAKTLVKLFGNFIRKGILELGGRDLNWKKWTPGNHNYILIDKKGFHLVQGLAEDRFNFWNSIKYKDNLF